jgi:hypothetical protein
MTGSDSAGSSSSGKEIIDAQARRIKELERALAVRHISDERSVTSNKSYNSNISRSSFELL